MYIYDTKGDTKWMRFTKRLPRICDEVSSDATKNIDDFLMQLIL